MDAVYARTVEAELGVPVLAGAFFTFTPRPLSGRGVPPPGPVGLLFGVIADLVAPAWRHLRSGRPPHWMYLAVTTDQVHLVDLVADSPAVRRVIRTWDRSSLYVVAAGTVFDLELRAAGGEVFALTASDPGPSARAVAEALVGSR